MRVRLERASNPTFVSLYSFFYKLAFLACVYFVVKISQSPLITRIHCLAPNNHFGWWLPKHFAN